MFDLFRANLPDFTMNSCTCINSASFSLFVLFSIPNKRSLVVTLIKLDGKYLDLASTNIGQTKKEEVRTFKTITLACRLWYYVFPVQVGV